MAITICLHPDQLQQAQHRMTSLIPATELTQSSISTSSPPEPLPTFPELPHQDATSAPRYTSHRDERKEVVWNLGGRDRTNDVIVRTGGEDIV
jgi:hypothetical protein